MLALCVRRKGAGGGASHSVAVAMWPSTHAPVQEDVLGHVCGQGDLYGALLALGRPHCHHHLLLVPHPVRLHTCTCSSLQRQENPPVP